MKKRRGNTNKGVIKTIILKNARDIMTIFWDVISIYFLGSTYADREKDKIKAQMAKEIFRKVEVVAKLKDRKMILHIEYISKENFTDAYDVLETTLTDSLS